MPEIDGFEFGKYFDEVEPAESVSMLFYGASKTGKTEAAGSAGARSLYIDMGKGESDTFHGPGFKQRKGAFKGIYCSVTEQNFKKNIVVPEKATAFDRTCDIIDRAFDRIPDKFDYLIIDGATSLRRYAMYKSLQIGQKIGGSKAQTNAESLGVAIPEVGDYNKEMSMVEQFIAGYLDICRVYNKHLIVIAHERHVYGKPPRQGEEKPLQRVLPGFTGQTFPDAVSNMFALVWHFEVENGRVYRAKTKGNRALVAGTKYDGIFNEYEVDVNVQDVVKKIRASVPLKKTK